MDTILGIPRGESYSGIYALVDLSSCIKYTNTEVMGSVAGGVAEGGSTRGRPYFRNDSGFLVKVIGKSKPSYTILFSSIIGENKQSYPVMINGYYTYILS